MSVGYLLDTNIVSEVRKRNGSPPVRAWVDSSLGPTLYLSALSIGEIRWGIELRRKSDPQQALVLERWLATLYASFRDRIVPISPDIAEEWGRLRTQRPLPTADALIAATAKVHGWSVVTRNVKDFDGIGVTVVNPFEWPV
ncbi:type II toxin-antitoxin system VapC family toxin [Nonomuraea sp. MCN248]|uniref:Ribonuclease VapC n=1 Tax=Nonomuraea corallina TaxID=2989783 RepID=A0ABT4SLL2_9ACTN|nr:type II toxin-antitoxin system VapC family toxin [Nonomuraea corallina]MDA0637975.1 type II toxin-antitoxin system VapC family toxin [Nonomuraea corallina]